jgi:plastocyanin
MAVIRIRWCALWLVLVLACFGCASETPVTPTVVPAAPTDPSTTTVIITASGVSPQLVQIQAGERVLFVNNDSVVHEMSSDQHPAHLDCPAMNQVGHLVPGQSRETGNFVTPGTCTYHDHLDALNLTLLGSIVIMETP